MLSWVPVGHGRQQAHSEACRRRIEGLLKGDSSGAARLAAADERNNRALADAVERHATNDPGMRGILKRTSVVCHPESEPQKKLALDTEQDSTPHPSVSCGGSSTSGARQSINTNTDQNTSTGDVTREVRTGPAQDVTRTISEDHIRGDVAMRGTVQTRTLGDTRAQRSQRAGGGSQRKENHMKQETSNRAPLNSTFREGSSRRRRHKSAQLPSPRKTHWTGVVRKRRGSRMLRTTH